MILVKKKVANLFLFLIFASSCSQTRKVETESSLPTSPNIIYILADDLGYGDLSCYGQQKFQTPNIDRLAKEGMKFMQHYSGATVCAPSRSVLMTGLHTGHTPVRGNKEQRPEGQWPLDDEAYTIAEMLKSSSYVTGAFGKWGLGFIDTEGDPNRQGFDQFFGYNCQRLAHNYYPEYLWDNHEKIMLPENSGTDKVVYAPEVIHKKALEFLDKNKDTTFFLFYPAVMPHAELFVPEKYMEMYRGKFLPEVSFVGVDDGETFRKGPYGSQSEAHAAFAGMVTLLDEMVGDIMNKVKELGLEKNTIIIFTSDNGPHKEGGADPDYFNSHGGLRGYKRDLYEGGIRVPMIAWWPEKINAGTVTDHLSAFWDVMPTFADVLGISAPENIDGISFLPTLLGTGEQEKHENLYWEFHEMKGRLALRRGDWKLIQYDVNTDTPGAWQLYNLVEDEKEQNDLAAKFPDKVEELKTILMQQRTESEVFKF